MKKLVAAAAAALFVVGIAGPATADEYNTAAGDVFVNEGGYLLKADGAESNPFPVGGYVSVSSQGEVCADDNGSDSSTSESPTCS